MEPQNDRPDANDRPNAKEMKKAYTPPQLVRLGSVRDLTLKSGAAADAGFTKPAVK